MALERIRRQKRQERLARERRQSEAKAKRAAEDEERRRKIAIPTSGGETEARNRKQQERLAPRQPRRAGDLRRDALRGARPRP